MSEYQDLLVDTNHGVLTVTINRPDNGNMLRRQTTLELLDVLRGLRGDRSLRVAILTGAGERFFCIGGEHDEQDAYDYSSVLPIVDVYQAIDTFPKPIIAAVNGYAVGAGNVLHTVCDLSIAAENAVFRQVGPMVGSFDAGYGSWYLEDTVGRKRAKEMWYLNRKYAAQQALEWGLVNDVVTPDRLLPVAREVADEIASRSPQAIAALKGAFSARHNGVAGQARLVHDQQLTLYLATREAHEMQAAFDQRRQPDDAAFWH